MALDYTGRKLRGLRGGTPYHHGRVDTDDYSEFHILFRSLPLSIRGLMGRARFFGPFLKTNDLVRTLYRLVAPGLLLIIFSGV